MQHSNDRKLGSSSMLNINRHALACALACAVFAAGMSSPPRAVADDIEVFFSKSNPDSTAKPNVLFILDTSQSMYSVEESTPKGAFDIGQSYSGDCDSSKYYWTQGTGNTPVCGSATAAGLTSAQFNCPAWQTSVNSVGSATKTSRIAQYVGSSWVAPTQVAAEMACQGDTTPSPLTDTQWKTKVKGKDSFPSTTYTFYSGNYLNWLNTGGGDRYRIDILRQAVGDVIASTDGIKVGLMRFGYDGDRDFRKNSATQCEVEPDPDEGQKSSNGAPIVFPVTDLDGSSVNGFPLSKDTYTGETSVRSQLRYQIGIDAKNEPLGWIVDPSLADADQPFQIAKGGGSTCPIPLFTPGGRSPIGGAMYEAFLYYSGSEWSQKYGKQAALGSTFGYPSVEQSRINGGDIYDSPIEDSCAKNFIILLSDGTTEQDNDIDGPVEKLPGFNTVVGKDCDKDPYLDVNGNPPPSQCVDDIAEYMFESDVGGKAVPNTNNVITYTVGFKLGNDAAANSARQLLQETADRGGGSFYEAGSAVELKDKVGKIVREILTLNTSFSAPAVTVNAFNRTQNLNDLYMSLFRPAFNYAWEGNIKKYQIDPLDGDILDATGKPAVDPSTGFFLNSARSFWSATTDGADISAGGASSLLNYGSRTFYTTSSGGTRVDLTTLESGLTDADLGIVAGDYIKKGQAASGALTAADLMLWFRGKDIADEDGNTITDESRFEMGDPLHAKPVTVIYGATGLNDDALYAVTNDGVLHAFDPDSNSASELWAFVPRPLTARMRDLYYNAEIADPTDRGYGLDGNIRVLRIDVDSDGIIESGDGDRVYLYFGQRRGGSTYYAFNVTNKNAPVLMWSASYAAQGAGQSWSTPVTARVRIGTTTQDVLIFGGGYDTTQDGANYAEDTVGRGVYMVNAFTGALLWRAGPDNGADLQLTQMKHSIPGDVRVVDLTGDGLADRMYAADLGGRLWRFDIFNGKTVAGELNADGDLERFVEGGMLASLGNAEDSAPRTESNTIRFFYAPDPSLITKPGPSYINIAIGSGHRELPASDTTAVNWMFSVRDYYALTPLRADQYKDDCSGDSGICQELVTEDDLEDLTSTVGASATDAVPVGVGGSRGWRLRLTETGEKVLAEARTFQSNVFFTTYAPVERGVTGDACGITFGLNKLYVVAARDARPAYNYDATVGEATEDRSKELAQGSIAPEVVFIFPTPPGVAATEPPKNCAQIAGCDEDDPSTWPLRPGTAVPPVCLVGLETCGAGMANPPIRTYWRQRGAN